MSHQDLARQLESFSISSEEEKVIHQLDKTHLEPVPNTSIFSIPTAQPCPHSSEQTPPAALQSNPIQQVHDNDWSTANANWSSHPIQTHDDDIDGWGSGPPSYTSITQGTYFGFNSIIAPSTAISNSKPVQLHNTQAFNRFRNRPVSFTSVVHTHNNDQDTTSSMQQ